MNETKTHFPCYISLHINDATVFDKFTKFTCENNLQYYSVPYPDVGGFSFEDFKAAVLEYLENNDNNITQKLEELLKDFDIADVISEIMYFADDMFNADVGANWSWIKQCIVQCVRDIEDNGFEYCEYLGNE